MKTLRHQEHIFVDEYITHVSPVTVYSDGFLLGSTGPIREKYIKDGKSCDKTGIFGVNYVKFTVHVMNMEPMEFKYQMSRYVGNSEKNNYYQVPDELLADYQMAVKAIDEYLDTVRNTELTDENRSHLEDMVQEFIVDKLKVHAEGQRDKLESIIKEASSPIKI